MIIETHCHLDYLKEHPLEDLLRLAQEASVEKIVTISVDPQNIHRVFELAQSYPQIYCTQGIHPHDVKDMSDDTLDLIAQRSLAPKVVAVGEIGLDYYYLHSPREIQLKRFEQQLELACQLDRPVVIHSRDADDDMISLLQKYAPQLKRKGVIHSFSSTLRLAEKALELDFYLGFNGMVTFKKAENVVAAVQICPLEKMLIETDAPFLTPVPFRGKENAPHYLPYILKKLAEIKNLNAIDLENTLYQNALHFFRF